MRPLAGALGLGGLVGADVAEFARERGCGARCGARNVAGDGVLEELVADVGAGAAAGVCAVGVARLEGVGLVEGGGVLEDAGVRARCARVSRLSAEARLYCGGAGVRIRGDAAAVVAVVG